MLTSRLVRPAWLGVLSVVLVMSACSGGDSTATTEPRETAASARNCTLTRRYLLDSGDDPAHDVTVTLADGGARTTIDARGRWSLDVGPRRNVVVRVRSESGVLDVTNRQGRRGSAAIPAGTAEVTYQLDAGCRASVVGVVSVEPGSARGRPQPPPLPDGFRPSSATRAARAPAAGAGTAARVPWTGSFWLSAPSVTAGICNIADRATRDAAEAALRHWQDAEGFGWQLRRDDAVCDENAPGPKMLILRETVDDDSFLGKEWEDAFDTPDCDPDAEITNCWIEVAYVAANPPGFDQLGRDEKAATMIHEIGHGLGLAHATVCAETIMWSADDCERSNRPPPGADDVASLNELLAATLAVLQRAP
ncbi:MAG: hypothetical protein HYX51_02560 [Chloroflexi bacterium]|nr:hypothetical protein [Chloroflexota bacterium]